MRPVKVERKMRGSPRTNAARTPVRVTREKIVPGGSFGKREKFRDDVFSRAVRRVQRFFRRPILLLVAALMVLTLVAALFASGVIGRTVRRVDNGFAAVVADAGFGISEIHITGNRRTPYNQVLEVLGMQPGQSIFTANLVGAQKKLSSLDWIAEAEVHRRYPDAIFVSLVEKRPFALWQSPPDVHGFAPISVVERSGGVITSRDVEKFRGLPKLIGAGAPAAAADLIDAVRSHRAVSARIAAYAYQSGRRWNLILDDGVIVQLPESGWQNQLDVLDHLIIDNGILERSISQIDLRSPTHIFFQLKSGETKDTIPGKDT